MIPPIPPPFPAPLPTTTNPSRYVPLPDPKPGQPIVLLGYYNNGPKGQDVPQLIHGIEQAHFPKGTPIYVGHYGVDKATAKALESVPGARYAPLFNLLKRDNSYWQGRNPRVTGEKTEGGRLEGPIPQKITAMTKQQRHDWGNELGRRMRDAMRLAGPDTKIDAWQLDELSPAFSQGKNSEALRDFAQGVLHGLYQGRPELGDKPMKGVAHITTPADSASHASKEFLDVLNRTTVRITGEEFPKFEGSASAAANHRIEGQDAFRDRGPVGKSLANKYVALFAPGLIPSGEHGIGGQQPGQSDAAAIAWRGRYLHDRADDGIAGFAAWNFLGANGTQKAIDTMMDQLSSDVRIAQRKWLQGQ